MAPAIGPSSFSHVAIVPAIALGRRLLQPLPIAPVAEVDCEREHAEQGDHTARDDNEDLAAIGLPKPRTKCETPHIRTIDERTEEIDSRRWNTRAGPPQNRQT